jgi:DNA-3-methyladenine glycosylase
VSGGAAAVGAELGEAFFDRSVHEVAPALIGCRLEVGECAGVIVETEAYDQGDPACHAFGGRTARNEVLFGPPGRAYVYLSYGIHSLLNAVAEPEGSAAAVLIRALEPTAGIELMRARRGREELHELCSGPGKLTQALGVGLELNGRPLDAPPFRILAPSGPAPAVEVVAGPRIGITKAMEHPWRYCAAANRHVSRPWPRAA